MSDALTEFRAKFRVDELCIARVDHWTWSVRPVQSTLGASILSLNQECLRWSDTSPAATAELHKVIGMIESKLTAAFHYDRINYLMLMMVDPQVHFHILPRYSSSREFLGVNWVDGSWPKPPDVLGQIASDPTLQSIRHVLSER